jgi:coenzyme F420-reducing hydrogenase beta subunit
MNQIFEHTLGEDFVSCTGCAACVAACPQSAISMQQNDEGFLYPNINMGLCSNCDLCRDICPVNQGNLFSTKRNEESSKKPLAVFAAWHLNEEIRLNSSSGGVFTALADEVLARKGVVFGAAFDENFVVNHISIENSDDLHKLRGSKYIQSVIRPSTYQSIRTLLIQNRPVLFSGTPCQVAGLHSFLGKPYDNLFCCDIACHGVPSPKVFEAYKKNMEEQYAAKITRISFRRKDCGWKRYSVLLSFDNNTEYLRTANGDPFILGFLKNIYLRPSCYNCKFASTDRSGDLTIADFWGVANTYPEYDNDDKGTSLILVNTAKGKQLLNNCKNNLFWGTADLNTAILGNPVLVRPSFQPPERDAFFHDLAILPFAEIVHKYNLRGPTKIQVILKQTKKILKNIVALTH